MWLKEPKTFKKIGYVTSIDINRDEIDLAYKEAAMDYEKAIIFFCGQKLWSHHRNTFREHKKYYFNQLRKPFGMSIVNFND